MKRMMLKLLLVAVFVFGGFATSHAADKVLHIYSAFDPPEAQYYIEAFEKETGGLIRISGGR